MSNELGKNKSEEFAAERASAQENPKEQLLGNNVIHQELGKNSGEVYESEKRHKSFQRHNKSFDEQRDQYAEQAMNQSEASSYVPQNISSEEPLPPVEDNYYKRYISRTDNDASLVISSESFPSSIDSESSSIMDYHESHISGSASDSSGNLYQRQIYKSNFDKENTLIGNTSFNTNVGRNQYRSLSKSGKKRLSSNKSSTLKIKSQCAGRDNTDRIHNKTESSGRLKFRNENSHKMSASQRRYGSIQPFNSRILRRRLFESISNSRFGDDEETDILRNTSTLLSGELSIWARKKARKLKSELDNGRLSNQKIRLNSDKQAKSSLSTTQKRRAEEAAKQKQLQEKEKKKIKKKMVQSYHREQGAVVQRARRQFKLKRVTKKERVIAAKRTKAIIGGFGILFLFFLILFLTFLIFISIGTSIFSESYVNSTSQNSYEDMSEVTEYFRQKEADLEEYIKPENIEPIISEEEPDIYEFIYELDEISFDANTLVAYLSARYNEFNLEMVLADLDEIFELYYTLSYEIKMEYRKVPDKTQPIDPKTGTYPLVDKLVPICYVRLEKADFYTLLKERMEDAAKQGQMDAFYLTGNGQQVYGPVMNIDWRNKISSNYGERIHPITGERKKHNGVDIAVPTGTALYSAVTGTVIDSHYSKSAGNMITVQTKSGWKVTFMHMDSRAVSVGDEVIQGQLVGYSGNTGNSTGPHLHLEVKNENDEHVNPVFIIPFSTAEASETFKGGK